MTTRDGDKASRYIDQLNTVRLSGSWTEVRELARKVAKHSPERQCLVFVATTEADFPAGTFERSLSETPGSGDRAAHAIQGLNQFLHDEKPATKQFGDDVFAARAMLACIHMLGQKWQDVFQTLERSHWDTVLQKATPTVSPVVRLSIIKAFFILGMAHFYSGSKEDAISTLQSALPYIIGSNQIILQHRELHRWASRVITLLCSITGDNTSAKKPSIHNMNEMLIEYRTWFIYSRNAPAEAHWALSTRSLWDSYHKLVSDVLRSNILYSGSERVPLGVVKSNLSKRRLTATRLKQFSELQRVERSYEQHLMGATVFPKAQESNHEYEVFVNRALDNWRIIMTSEWTNADVGEGGKLAYSRNVLELLYRAASKTFHSTPILRHLFNVHAQLGDLDLAIHAFDSYTEIVTKGKARAEKTGKHEIGLDDDDTVLYTAAEAIKVLCLYGERPQAEKAYEIGELITTWLHQQRPRSSSSASIELNPTSSSEKVAAETFSTPSARAAAYRAIGQSQATWARHAFETLPRQELQSDALQNLQRSWMLSSSTGVDLETAYLLAYSQAEKRQTKAALTTLRQALASDNVFSPARILANPTEETFEDRRRKLPLMHLYVLLLSARGEFDAAFSLCEVTIEQLIDAARSCDEADGLEATNGTHGESKIRDLPLRLTQRLEDAEREAFLQMNITEMELLIVTDNISYVGSKKQELIKTYEQLFGNPGQGEDSQNGTANTSTLPKSRSGTIKSFRQSVFGRPKTSSRRSLDSTTFEKPPPMPDHPLLRQSDGAQQQSLPNPPSVTITDTDGEKLAEEESKGKMSRISMSIRRGMHRHHHHHEMRKMASAEALSDRRAFSDPPPLPTSTSGDDLRQVQNLRSVDHTNAHTIDHPQPTTRDSTDGSATTADQTLIAEDFAVPQNNHDDTLDTTPAQDLRIVDSTQLPARTPPPTLGKLARTTHYISILVEVWLFIARMYMQESLHSDASAAVDEAHKLVEQLQTEIAAAGESSGRAWLYRGWGLGKSISRLMGDVWAQRGHIALTTSTSFKALAYFERSVVWYPEHPLATPALAKIMFDMHDRVTPLEPPGEDELLSAPASNPAQDATPLSTVPVEAANIIPSSTAPTPEELNRLACRDRGHMLLNSATKLGESWDDPEAWFQLARARESAGSLESAAGCYWWVVELEDSKPVRHWRCVGGLV
ncbi:hypothetical protein K461DRAFT_274407 [Myriangium duriaei CBS 260.36]|uniref:Filamentation protein n=1 Tax=Myriangium duriaei CBS 260.36 TaxID=1168546 RepID=A0A9P4MKE3_9PEZI|nr:hypothetical protein K461DRAFT_274407 [Myriangium duriaei CBS 260.36]